MRMRVVVTAVSVWLGVVALASGLTWLVIDQVGRGVAASPSISDAPRAGRAEPSEPSASASAPVPRPTRRPGEARPTAAPVPDEATTAPSAGAAPRTAAPAPTTRTPTPKPQPQPQPGTKPAPAPADAKVTRTWTGAGGRVTVSCTGSRATLESASPANGWTVSVDKRGPEEVEVTFEHGDGGPETDVHAVCRSGSPSFTGGSDG